MISDTPTPYHTESYGTLFVVATPIGNLDELSARGAMVLNQVDVIACEDTRHTRLLTQHFNINTPLISHHEHSHARDIDEIIARLLRGQNVALVSDAGTPAISDPGFLLVRAAHTHGIKVSPITGACAAIAALCASGLPSDRFTFIGFLPAKTTARTQKIAEFATRNETLIIYESPHRILDSVHDMLVILGDRTVCFCRELTKNFETIWHGKLTNLPNFLATHHQQKGEMVLIIEGAKITPTFDDNAKKLLSLLADELPATKAASLASKFLNLPKKALYAHLTERTS